ncbi:MAG: hypothetical protein SPL28_08200, partial [Bacteroidales bacterium]|nr:hypothetical protein [Bacteroidales bacterium]
MDQLINLVVEIVVELIVSAPVTRIPVKFLLWWIKTNIPGAKVELDKKVGNIYMTKGVSDSYP